MMSYSEQARRDFAEAKREAEEIGRKLDEESSKRARERFGASGQADTTDDLLKELVRNCPEFDLKRSSSHGWTLTTMRRDYRHRSLRVVLSRALRDLGTAAVLSAALTRCASSPPPSASVPGLCAWCAEMSEECREGIDECEVCDG